MARSIQQIKNELASIEKTVTGLAVELFDVDTKYLNSLGNLAARQLVISVYQLCTQIYPDPFLKLPYARREKLQQDLRNLGKKLETLLFASLDSAPEKEQTLKERLEAGEIPDKLNIVEQMLDELSASATEADDEESEEDEDDLSEEELEEELENWRAENDGDLILTAIKLPETLDELPETEEITINSEEVRERIKNITDPEELSQWQKQVEKGIRKTLEKISREVNRCLQKQEILPNHLPSQILDAAVQAQETASPVSSVSNFPNILNLVIETENKDKSKKANVIQLTVLRLRLSEIEFAEPTLSVERNQIRSLVAKIEQLKQQYRKKQRECKIAEAEAAWRSSWYEN
jgi:hypothetical protein